MQTTRIILIGLLAVVVGGLIMFRTGEKGDRHNKSH